ncbi:MAG: T9SS type A sorting domain-containing protein [bacterium]|nr:T9SS type A sorting domain-containing protein [bacterium]
MKRFIIPLTVLGLLITTFIPGNLIANESPRRLFFLHHSTGRLLIEEGNVRHHLINANNSDGSDLVLWDHDYNYIGLSDNEGDLLGYDYSIPEDNTDPDGLHQLWTTSNSARDSLLARYDIIAFKSCYPTCDISSETQLDQYKQWYLEMRDFFDTKTDITFIIMSPPPRHRLSTNLEHADRARRFANWLMSDEYLYGHTNLVGFDFFDLCAQPDDGSPTRNMLRYDFERSHTNGDSHPNALANQTNAPLFVEVLVNATEPSTSSARNYPEPVLFHHNHPNPFNPLTVISFGLEQAQFVELKIFNIHGQHVRTLFSETRSAGNHSVNWNGRNSNGHAVSSGMYLYQISGNENTVVGKMILAR